MVKLFALTLTASFAVSATAAYTFPQAACNSSGQGCALDCSPAAKDGLKYQCWEFLNMTGYLNDWAKTEGPKVGLKEKGFAQAYLSWSGRNGDTCNLITSDTCDKPATDNNAYRDWQQFYTLWNIFAIWQFHTQYYTALGDSQSLAAGKIGKIVDKVSPPLEQGFGLAEWVYMFSLGLQIFTLGVSFVVSATVTSVAIATTAYLIVNSLWLGRNIPHLGEAGKHYTQSAKQRFTTLADIASDLADLVIEYKKVLTLEVQIMQDDLEVFLALCGNGAFSQRVDISLDKQSTVAYKALMLFVLAESLTATGIIVTKSTGVDPRKVAQVTGQIDCHELGPAGNCNGWWFGKGNTYSLHDTHKGDREFKDLLTWLLDENIVEDLSEIFAQEACAGKKIPLQGLPDPKSACVFNVKNCEWKYSTHSSVQGKQQFKNCDNDPYWMRGCMGNNENLPSLPLSYVGPLMHGDSWCRPNQART